jgi:(heptosyl)LPS beta-1,4-glucosyltransferase
VDCFSKDATCKIAEKVADAIYKVEFKGFGHLRSFALGCVNTEWVLFLDADERVEERLWKSIKEAMSRGEDAFYIPRKSHFLGRWIRRCGWYPDYVLRLLKKEKVYYDEKVLVHERPFVKGKVGYIKGAHLLHYPYTSWQECLQKVQLYSALFAKQRGSAPSIFSAFFKAIASFINVYIVKGGFLEKEEGLALSVLQSFYTFLKYAR